MFILNSLKNKKIQAIFTQQPDACLYKKQIKLKLTEVLYLLLGGRSKLE
jgi:hypothetical protein